MVVGDKGSDPADTREKFFSSRSTDSSNEYEIVDGVTEDDELHAGRLLTLRQPRENLKRKYFQFISATNIKYSSVFSFSV